MSINFETIIISPIVLVTLGFLIYSNLKKRKRSAKYIYKLIDDLEKKYIY